jgi:hypothetical protein
MQYIVPQFIEREPKIFGPFTFKQFIYIGTAGGITIFLYFFIKSILLFLFIAFLLMGSATALAFFKTGGFPLPSIIQNFFIFFSRPKVYLWKKKTIPPKIAKKVEIPKKEKEEKREESILKIVERGRLRELYKFLETKSR